MPAISGSSSPARRGELARSALALARRSSFCLRFSCRARSFARFSRVGLVRFAISRASIEYILARRLRIPEPRARGAGTRRAYAVADTMLWELRKDGRETKCLIRPQAGQFEIAVVYEGLRMQGQLCPHKGEALRLAREERHKWESFGWLSPTAA